MKLLIATSICLLVAACDRLAYESKNNPITKAAAGVYKDINRIPLDAQIKICQDLEKTGKDFTRCMNESGYVFNRREFDACMASGNLYCVYDLQRLPNGSPRWIPG